MHDAALTTHQVTGLGIGVIAVIVVLGLVAAVIVTKLLVRLLVVVVVVALAVVVWTQRSAVVDAAGDAAKRCDATFFGIHIEPDNSRLREACQDITNR